MSESNPGTMLKKQRYGKYDVEMAKISRDIEKSANTRGNIKAIFKYTSQIVLYICTAFCIWKITTGTPIILEKLANLIEQWNISKVISLAVNIVFFLILLAQRMQIKRFTKKSGDMRHKIEYNDAVNTRSGLSPIGTAKEDENED